MTSSTESSSPVTYARQHRSRFVEDLKSFVRIPSISAQPEHHEDVEAAAQWLRDQLLEAGYERAAVIPTSGNPVVVGEWLAAGPQAPTVLVYGHYDVQPPEPLDEWTSPPFDPTVRGDDLFARGASDDKGQTLIHVKAAEAFRATRGAPPVNLKFIAEGEEEVGSPSLEPFVRAHRDLLAADVAVISDTAGRGLNMRADASVNAIALKVLQEGAEVTIIGGPRDADGFTWFQVRDAAETEGWVASDWLVRVR